MQGLALEYLNRNLPNMTIEIDDALLPFHEWWDTHRDEAELDVIKFLHGYKGEYDLLAKLIIADLDHSMENRRSSDTFDEFMFAIWEEDWNDFD